MATDADRPLADENPAIAETQPPERKPFQLKGFASLLLALSFSVAAFSGVILYLTPRGRTAHWTDWAMLGLGKEDWGAMHMNACLLLLAVSAIHLLLNWTMFLGYLRKKASGGVHLKRELATAVVVTAVLLLGTIYTLPPFEYLADLNMQIKNSWEQTAAQAPVPHSEELTLVRFAEQIQLPVDEMAGTLAAEGFQVDDLEQTVGELAQQQGVAPSQIMAVLRRHHPDLVAGGFGMGRGRGFGGGFGLGGAGGGCSGEAGDSCSDDTCSETALAAGGCSREIPAGEACRTDEGDKEVGCSGAVEDDRHVPGWGAGGGRGPGHGMGRGPGRGMGRGMGPGAGSGPGAGPTHQAD